MGQATIDQVAKTAGVSKSTVSYVLSGKRRISEEVVSRVHRVMDELNYTPRGRKPVPKQLQTRIVGLYVPILQERLSEDFFYYPVIEGVLDSLNEQRYRLLLNKQTSSMNPESIHDFIEDHMAEGIIVMNPLEEHIYVDYLKNEKIPFVIIGTPEMEKDVFYVDIDAISAAYRAARYLMDRGHTRILNIIAKKGYMQTIQLEKGLRLAYEEEMISLDPEYIVHSAISMHTGYDLCRTAIEKGLDFTAVIAQNEIVAKGVLEALSEHKISVPEKAAVMSLGGNPIGMLNNPKITSIDFSPYEMGFQAGKMLIEVIKKKRIKPSHLLLPSKLIKGETC